MSISTEPRENVHDQTELRTSMGKFNMDLEILQSRFDSLQSLVSTQNDLLTGADDLVNEVTRMRLELEEEKVGSSWGPLHNYWKNISPSQR